jgi:hypothetical protein
MRLRRGYGLMSGKLPQIRVPRHQEASLTDEGDFTAVAGSSRLQMSLRGRTTVRVGTQVDSSA